jgi:polar amino acid transport system substrate-binding protein
MNSIRTRARAAASTCALTCAFAVLVALAFASPAGAQDAAAKQELAPNGTLHVGVAVAPQPSPLFATKDADGKPVGVTVDLGTALAKRLGVPVEFFVAPNTGELTDALAKAAIDVSFMPVDAERKARVAFGPFYVLVESTYMATAASGAKTVADVDRAGMRVIGIAGTTTIRSAAASLKNTTITPMRSVDDALAALRDGQADAFALGRDTLPAYVKQIPGSIIVDGYFQRTGVAIAVPLNRFDARAYVTTFMEDAKKSGLVRQALDKAGFNNVAVAPAAE